MFDISPRLEAQASQSLYMQLYDYFKEEIQHGRLATATRLPSIRRLADYLKVSKTTVEMAYQQLLAEGYIESRERSGFFVVALEADLLSGQTVEVVNASQIQQSTDTDSIRFNFHLSSIDGDVFPFAVWRKLTSQTIQYEQRELLSYGERQGEWGLRREIGSYLRQARGVNCTAEQIVIGSGTQMMVGLLCQMLGLTEKRIAMEDPGYQDVRYVCQHHGFEVVPVPLEEDGIDIARLTKSGATVVYITPSHQYPTGIVMPIAKRMKLLQWAEETGGLIIEDDYDGEFRYRGKPIPSLQGLDTKGNVIYLGTFSKAFIPSIRVSYMVLPEKLLTLFKQKFLTYDQTVSRLQQKTLEMFMNSGEWGRHIRRMRTVYQKKHAVLIQAIKATMNEKVRITGQDAGLHLAIEVETERTGEELIKYAAEAGVRVYAMTDKWLTGQQEKPPKILIGFGGLKSEEIDEGIRRLHEAWAPHYR